MQAATTEQAFPRGGTAGGTTAVDAVRKKQGDGGAAAGGLFGRARLQRVETKDPKKGKGKGRSGTSAPSISGLAGVLTGGKSGSGDESKAGLGHTRLSANGKTLKVEPMTFGRYVPGVVALGYVLQLHETRAIISLPGGVVGTVEYTEVSDVTFRRGPFSGGEKKRRLNDGAASSKTSSSSSSSSSEQEPGMAALLKPMQPVRCYVLGTQERPASGSGAKGGATKRTLQLSLRASYINKFLSFKHLNVDFPVYGCVVSKEDHGYVVATGMSSANFFLPSKNVPAALGDIVIGALPCSPLSLSLSFPLSPSYCCCCCCGQPPPLAKAPAVKTPKKSS